MKAIALTEYDISSLGEEELQPLFEVPMTLSLKYFKDLNN